MLKKQAEENGKVCFREGYSGIVPSMNSYSDGYVSSGNHTPSAQFRLQSLFRPLSQPSNDKSHCLARQNNSPDCFGFTAPYSGGGLEGTYSGRGLDSANTRLEASALTPASYGATGGNGGQQVAGGYGNNYAADYVQPAIAAENGQSMLPGGMTPAIAQNLAGGLKNAGNEVHRYTSDLIGTLGHYSPVAMTLLPEYLKLGITNLSDINKHQYLACKIAQNYGDNMVNDLGTYKEHFWDIPSKVEAFNKGENTDYNSLEDIYRDSEKDMTNNDLGSYYAKKEAERLGGYDKVDCSPLKASAIGGKYLDAMAKGKSAEELASIAKKEPNPIPLDFIEDKYYNPYSHDILSHYKKNRYGS